MELAAGNGDRIQLFGSGHRYFESYRSYGARIVPLLEVDNLDQASAELARGGAEVLGGPESDGTWTWLTFRMPDGNIHSLGARMGWLAGQKTLVERARYASNECGSRTRVRWTQSRRLCMLAPCGQEPQR